jgi:signal transduction histidine kinase
MPGSRTGPVSNAVVSMSLAAASVASALGLWLLLGRILPYTFFLFAVALTAWLRGTRAGIVALLLSIAVLDYVVDGAPYEFGISAANATRIATYTMSSVLLLWVIAARHRAEDALRAARDELDERVRERTASLALTNQQLQEEIDERKRSERRLAAAAARLARTRRRARERLLEGRFSAMLEERTRLAREIHDTLLQGFTGVSFQLLAAMGKLNGAAESNASLNAVLALAQKTLADARQAVWDMRPPALQGDDFCEGLRTALDATQSGAALTFDYAVRGVPRALEPQVETVVFRVAQEAVANVVKHADARSVRVTVAFRERSVRLFVGDDGRGFIVQPDLHSYAGHWGLLGMRERASQLRGKLSVRSAPGAGTKIVLHVPTARAMQSSERVM